MTKKAVRNLQTPTTLFQPQLVSSITVCHVPPGSIFPQVERAYLFLLYLWYPLNFATIKSKKSTQSKHARIIWLKIILIESFNDFEQENGEMAPE